MRGSGGGNGARLLVLPTLRTNADQGRLDAFLAGYELLRDTTIAATAHFYGFWPFSKFLEAVGHHARTRDLTTVLWDAGQFLDRNALRRRDQGLYDLIRSSWTTRSGTAASDRPDRRTGRRARSSGSTSSPAPRGTGSS